MKTTHQLAAELMALPDVPVVVEMWTRDEPFAKMTLYDPEGTAMIVSKSTLKGTGEIP